MKNCDHMFYPITKSDCASQCAWYCDGKCALVVLNEYLLDVASAINAVQWAIKERPDNY